ncbi:hypothetical protein SUNI508_05519 [Seiridium unicorne]|uniref:BZIP domain-containing protein n=1 Tax=Seiridium unicorne TaxID=138068 RepID=A0ABR2V4V1_9PEZI
MMDYWSPNESTALLESDQIRAYTTDDFSAHYGMNMLPPNGLSSLQGSLAPSDLYNTMVEMEDVKHEPDWEGQTSSTPESENTPHTDLSSVTTSTGTRSKKKRRSTSDSNSIAFPSSDLSREKNRVAASKCRRKKKAEEQQLEERRRMLQVQNAILQDSAAQLRNEVLHLKNEILKHGTCDYPPIQSYIKTAASQIR